MNDIDLIPASYRQARQVSAWLKWFVIAYAVLLLGTGVAKALLSNSLESGSVAITELKTSQSGLLSQKAEYEQLQSQGQRLAGHLQMLEKLRAGTPVKEVFLAIDRALNGEVWFLDWEFLRAGEYVPARQQAVNTGYFIIVPPENSANEQRAWQMSNHMKIHARAINHSALAEFVSRLSNDPVIAQVKINNTRIHTDEFKEVVDFTLTVIVQRLPGTS